MLNMQKFLLLSVKICLVFICIFVNVSISLGQIKITIPYYDVVNQSAPASPASGSTRIYIDTSNVVHTISSSGTNVSLLGTTGIPVVLNQQGNSAPITCDESDQVAYTFLVPANSISSTGELLFRYQLLLKVPASTVANFDIIVSLGGNDIFAIPGLDLAIGSLSSSQTMNGVITIASNGSLTLNSSVGSAFILNSTSDSPIEGADGVYTAYIGNNATIGCNMANANTLMITVRENYTSGTHCSYTLKHASLTGNK